MSCVSLQSRSSVYRAALISALVLGVSTLQAQPREPWTTSRIHGTPEPPKPFVSEHVFPQLSFDQGLELVGVPGSQRFLVVERRGTIRSFSTGDATPAAEQLIDLRTLHPRLGNSYGIVLHPRFRETRQLFICYTLPPGEPEGTRVSRFALTSVEPLQIDPRSEEIILTWVSGGHNGGNLQFGPDGYLYISTGDSGSSAPPDRINTGQDPSDLPGSILRIDVDRRDPGKNYRVPPDNPWFKHDHGIAIRPELWAFGLRNPWKISFDRKGNLWCADVGWQLWEMIYLVQPGANYGWSAYEASQPVKPQLANSFVPISAPTVAHPHSEAASITGGFVYQGKQLPELAGAYVYGDFVTGKIWALWHDGRQITRHEEIADTPHAIVTFGLADDGELYYLHYGDRTTLHRLVRNPRAVQAGDFPRTLGETGLFADVARQQPAAGVYPFTIGMPLWQDGAEATRWIGLRDRSSIVTKRAEAGRGPTEYNTTWPSGAVLARTVTLGKLALTSVDRTKPIETQILHYDGEAWNAYAYRWNEAGTDAELVPPEGLEVTIRAAADPLAAGPRERDYQWRFASRAECLRCHNSRHGGPLAFTPYQLRGVTPQQTKPLIDRGVIDGHFLEQRRRGGELARAQPLDARTVLQVNCAPCHSQGAGGSVAAFMDAELPLNRLNILGVPPTQGSLGLQNPKIVDPGDPWNSVLAVRMAKLGSGHMPPIGPREVDVEGLRVIENWIAQLAPESGKAKSQVAWDEAAIARAVTRVEGAMRLRRAIDDGKLDANARTAAFTLAWASSESTVRDIFERFKPDAMRERVLGTNIDPAELLKLAGDRVRGAKLVSADGKLANCQACHFIQGQGRHFGPDLSRIGSTQTSAQLLESIVSPSKTIAPLFRTTLFEMRDGTKQLGFVRARGVEEILLTLPGGQSLKLKRADIITETSTPTSLMPEGLLQGLTPQEAADLIAYLVSLK